MEIKFGEITPYDGIEINKNYSFLYKFGRICVLQIFFTTPVVSGNVCQIPADFASNKQFWGTFFSSGGGNSIARAMVSGTNVAVINSIGDTINSGFISIVYIV